MQPAVRFDSDEAVRSGEEQERNGRTWRLGQLSEGLTFPHNPNDLGESANRGLLQFSMLRGDARGAEKKVVSRRMLLAEIDEHLEGARQLCRRFFRRAAGLPEGIR